MYKAPNRKLIQKLLGNKTAVRLAHQKTWLPILHIFGEVHPLLESQCSEKKKKSSIHNKIVATAYRRKQLYIYIKQKGLMI